MLQICNPASTKSQKHNAKLLTAPVRFTMYYQDLMVCTSIFLRFFLYLSISYTFYHLNSSIISTVYIVMAYFMLNIVSAFG